jgi:ubiquinone/menaquinone biosynthesis C-methylase UbiE
MKLRLGLRNLLAWFNQYRLGFFRHRMATALVHDEVWHQPLSDAIAPQPGERILVVGPNAARLARTLATRFRTTHFTAADSRQASIDRGRRTSSDLDLVLHYTALDQPLPFVTAAFDKVVPALALHELPPQQKQALLAETRRTLRRDGTLYAAEYDKPALPSETAALKATPSASGIAAAQPHLDGSWITLLGRAGFTNIRALSSYSVRFGRVALVKARKL